MAEQKPVQVALRLPPDMHRRLREMADEDRRSLHSMILVLLDRSLAQQDDQAKIAA